MNKKQLIARVQRYMGPGATRNTASAAVEAVLASIGLATKEENARLHIAHFGTFERTTRPARQGYDINTGTMRRIPARSELTFKPAAGFLPEQAD
ncbi:MAG: HU family DNA-binding protein [Akkermansia sp.]|nr:HU family DNA-binding protein [Akkermansia sp.]